MPTPPHRTDLSGDSILVNPASLAALQGRTGRFGFPTVLKFTSLEERERAIFAAGGPELSSADQAAASAREALEATLTPAQRGLYNAASEARADAALLRADAVEEVTLAHGIAFGAALLAFPEDPPEALARSAAGFANATLSATGSSHQALGLGDAVLSAMKRAASLS